MARTVSLHKKEIVLNRNKLKSVLDEKGMTYTDLYLKLDKESKYGLDISYKGFMSLLSNRNTWKLLYAYVITEILLININDIFELIDIDVDKKAHEKEKWREKYQKD